MGKGMGKGRLMWFEAFGIIAVVFKWRFVRYRSIVRVECVNRILPSSNLFSFPSPLAKVAERS
jgi:hypothetical protein